MRTLFVIAVVATAYSHALSSQIETEPFIQSINEKATTWRARRNFEGWSIEQLKSLAGVIGINSDPNVTLPVVVHEVRDGIPASFDSREIWPSCDSLKTIRDQGACGSCWVRLLCFKCFRGLCCCACAVLMSDRLCISSKGAKQFVFSPEELVSCCTPCGRGCQGGYMSEPFNYWRYNGIPSGGDYNSRYGCRPYTAAVSGQTPQCTRRCVPDYNVSWTDDIRHGIESFQVPSTVEQIQQEIVINGSVSAYMKVFEDFFSYGGGIYQHINGTLVGGHAVKIIGWGSENGVNYWIVANSWGTGFGESGFFRILRGFNSVGIESYVVAGTPNTNE